MIWTEWQRQKYIDIELITDELTQRMIYMGLSKIKYIIQVDK